MQHLEAWFIFFGCFNMALVSSVWIGWVLFAKLSEDDPKEGLVMIAIFCWFLVNLSISFGFPEDGSPLCTLQAVLWLYGTKTAVNWWALLMYRWLSDTTSCRALSTLVMHAIGWSS